MLLSRFTRTLAAGMALLAPGCQYAFGNYDVGVGSSGGGLPVATGGDSSTGGASELGGASAGGSTGTGGSTSLICSGNQSFRCDGIRLLQCKDETWTLVDTCNPPRICDFAAGYCDACSPGDLQCNPSANGDTVLMTCNDERKDFRALKTCTAPLYCDKDYGDCVRCTPLQFRCSTADPNYRDRCLNDGSAWDIKAEECYGYGCDSTDPNDNFCIQCIVGTSPPGCVKLTLPSGATKWNVKSCVGGKWTTTQDCPSNCQDATASSPIICY